MRKNRKPKGTAIDGWLNVNKPVGVTSAQAVGLIKKALNAQKVGHGGTLDPLADGVLPIALGKATKTMQFSLDADKTYRFTITFGEQRSTDDAEGEVLFSSDERPTREDVEGILSQFTGEIEQTPPLYSALKFEGKAAYERVRAGEEIDMESKRRVVTVYSFDLEAFDGETATFLAKTSKGFYIRSLARDMGQALGCYGYISQLMRVKAGPFVLEEAIDLEKFNEYLDKNAQSADITGQELEFLRPVDAVLADIPAYQATGAEVKDLKQGRVLKRVHLSPGQRRVLTPAGKCVALVTVTELGILQIERNFQ